MTKLKKFFQHGEKGFTLIELLIVSLILGTTSAIVIPNVHSFLGMANLASANSEVATTKTAGDCYYADNWAWPSDSSNFASYGLLDRSPEETYSFVTTNSNISSVTSSGK